MRNFDHLVCTFIPSLFPQCRQAPYRLGSCSILILIASRFRSTRESTNVSAAVACRSSLSSSATETTLLVSIAFVLALETPQSFRSLAVLTNVLRFVAKPSQARTLVAAPTILAESSGAKRVTKSLNGSASFVVRPLRSKCSTSFRLDASATNALGEATSAPFRIINRP